MDNYLKNLSLISHEVRGSLSVVKAFIEILEKGMLGPVNNRQVEKLRMTEDRLDEINILLFNVITATRIDAGILKPGYVIFDFGEVVSNVVSTLVSRAERYGITLEFEVPERSFPVRCDNILVGNAVTNICANALKFTPQGGKVSVKIDSDPENVVLIVSDTGIGIPKSLHQKIFEEYFRIEDPDAPRGGGVGLGLSVSKEIAKLSGGRIIVESERGAGSKFRFILPSIQ